LFIEKVHNLFFSIYGCNYFMHFEIKMWKMLITWVLHFVNRKSYVLIRWMRPLYPNICKVHKKLEILLLYTFFFYLYGIIVQYHLIVKCFVYSWL
jgi:hypothetical protein